MADLSWDDSTRAEIVQCLHDMIRPWMRGTCRRSSRSVYAGLSSLHEFILDNSLVSEKVENSKFRGTWCLAMAGS